MSVPSKQTSGVWVRSSIDEHVQVINMFKTWCSSLFDEMVFDPSLDGGLLCCIAFQSIQQQNYHTKSWKGWIM